jgi:hypothetical protein
MEYVVLEFEGNQFRGEIASALRDVVAKGVIRIADLILVKKDQGGDVTVLELKDLGKDATAWEPVMSNLTSLFAQEDIEQLANELRPNSSAAMVLFEHTWAANLREAVRRAKGRLVANGFVPPEAVEEVLRKRRAAAA